MRVPSAVHAGRWLLLLLLLALAVLVLLVILRRRRVCRRRQTDFDSADCAHGTAALFAYAMELIPLLGCSIVLGLLRLLIALLRCVVLGLLGLLGIGILIGLMRLLGIAALLLFL